jgi:hypothetical protein
MWLPILRSTVLALILAASPVSIPGELFTPAEKPIVLASSDVLACDFPHHLPNDVTAARLRVNSTSVVPLWRADIYDLADCLRAKSEKI